MHNKKTIFITLLMILPVFLIANTTDTKGQIDKTTYGEQNTINEVAVGDLAPDFTIMDVDTRINHTLYDYHGRMVLIDLWATWCGPCEISLPYIRQFYDMYPEEMLTIISIDIDETETDAEVSGFRKSHNMDWIVGIDYDNSIQSVYGSGFVPTFYLLNTTGHVVWYKVGIDEANFYDDLYGHISQYFPDDVTSPTINDFDVTNKSTEFSIFNPSFRIFANISEDRKLQFAEAAISTSVETKYPYLSFKKIGDFYIINQTYTFDPEDLYGEDKVSIEVTFTDFWDLSVTTDLTNVFITDYVDSGPPTLENVDIVVDVIDETKYNVTVYATITEDLMLTKADVRLMKGESIIKAFSFEEHNTTHMKAVGTILVNLAQADELTARIVLEDVAGNVIEEDFTVSEDGGEPEKTRFNYLFAVIGLLLTLGLINRRRN